MFPYQPKCEVTSTNNEKKRHKINFDCQLHLWSASNNILECCQVLLIMFLFNLSRLKNNVILAHGLNTYINKLNQVVINVYFNRYSVHIFLLMLWRAFE